MVWLNQRAIRTAIFMAWNDTVSLTVQQIILIAIGALIVLIILERLGLLRKVGVLIRAPIVGVLALLWIVYVWWWIAAIRIGVAIAFLVLVPLTYPIFQAFRYILELLKGLLFPPQHGERIQVDRANWYLDGWPDRYLKWCQSALVWGFPTLVAWWLEGWSA